MERTNFKDDMQALTYGAKVFEVVNMANEFGRRNAEGIEGVTTGRKTPDDDRAQEIISETMPLYQQIATDGTTPQDVDAWCNAAKAEIAAMWNNPTNSGASTLEDLPGLIGGLAAAMETSSPSERRALHMDWSGLRASVEKIEGLLSEPGAEPLLDVSVSGGLLGR